MHNRALHDILAAFVEEAAWQLAEEVSGGAEIPFELIEQGRQSAPLYCYRPLTQRFLAERAGSLARLPSYAPAVQGMMGLPDLPGYLRARGRRPPGADARVAGRRRAAGVRLRDVERTRPTSRSTPSASPPRSPSSRTRATTAARSRSSSPRSTAS